MNTKNLLAILAVVVVVLAGGAYMMSNNSKTEVAAVAQVPTNPTQGTTPTDATVTPSTAPAALKYKDGTYSATGEYRAPSGPESITVSLTLKDDMIVDSTVTSTATNPGTKQNQGKFMSGYKALVTGKSIDDVVLSNVSGSSLTPIGWNAAVETIKTEAKA